MGSVLHIFELYNTNAAARLVTGVRTSRPSWGNFIGYQCDAYWI